MIIAAALVARVYLSIPYDVAAEVAIALGAAQAFLIVYAHLGRGFHIYHVGHAAEYENN